MAGNLRDNFMGSVTVGERGQVVIPVQARERCRIQPGDKLLAFVTPGGEGVSLVRLEAVAEMAANLSTLVELGIPAEEPEEEAAE
jgi:AbrB family looped-hinge helix DNA binding protein